jgi:hypothetical protein
MLWAAGSTLWADILCRRNFLVFQGCLRRGPVSAGFSLRVLLMDARGQQGLTDSGLDWPSCGLPLLCCVTLAGGEERRPLSLSGPVSLNVHKGSGWVHV